MEAVKHQRSQTVYKIGLEKEAFLLKDGQPQIIPNGMPKDGCGLLVEARSEAFFDPTQAVFSLMASYHDIEVMAKEKGMTLDESPIKVIPRDLTREAARTNAKGLIEFQNLYGFKDHKHARNEYTAGIHISFTNPGSYTDRENRTITMNKIFDFVQLFKKIDKAFDKEIKDAKRNPGFYELKRDGRIEYRSLPANVDLKKVIEVLKCIFKGKDWPEVKTTPLATVAAV